ncbi:MAG: OB-fold nucleic acid binding domain-containing protein [Planctomycetota bacterium]|jgi:asparaginyl-tRNA synthetase
MTNNNSAYISELKDYVDRQVTLAGWLYESRSSGKVQFLVLRYGTGLCQCVGEKSKVPEELFSQLKHLGQESSLTVTGTVRADERSLGGFGLGVERTIAWLTALKHIRQCIPFPRMMDKVYI